MITAPGLYDIDIDAYHHAPRLCDGPSISASGLKQVVECPAKYWAFSPYNPNRFEKKETKALDIGRAAHAIVLGEPEFAKHFVISPHDEFRTGAAKAWRDEQTRTVLKAAEFETIQVMAKAQKLSRQCARAFEDGAPEKSLIWKDAETGIWLKSRPDWLPRDPKMRFITEYKSAETIEPSKWSSAAFGYGYEIQAALQVDGVKACMGIEPLGVAHVIQEKSPPYLCELRMFGADHLEDGRYLYRRALRLFARCLKTGDWPGYTTEPQFAETPYWFAKMMEGYRNGIDSTAGNEAERQWDREWQRPLEPAEHTAAD